ncbi:HD domain-containing protein [Patescibacteria group bacterium]|nr:HD domain-containing protein [Patescibacteria group bacterium]
MPENLFAEKKIEQGHWYDERIGPTRGRFREWSKKARQVEEQLSLGLEPTRITLSENLEPVFEYDNRWGEWLHGREKLEYIKNTVYACAECNTKRALELQDTQQVERIMAKYPAYSAQIDNLGLGENKLFSYVALAGVRAEQQVLARLEDYGETSATMRQPISYTLATRMLAEYIDAYADIIEDCESNSLDYKKGQIPPQLAPVLLETLAHSVLELETTLTDYTDFSGLSMDVSTRLETAKERLANLKVHLESGVSALDKGHTEGNSDSGWVFYATAARWPIDTPNTVICSHSPGLNWEGAFSERDYLGGVLLTSGEPFNFFNRDMHTSIEEFALGKEWTLEDGCELQNDTYVASARRNGDNITWEEGMREQLAEVGASHCSSCAEAWETRSDLYTEIWMGEPEAYALWVPLDWAEQAREGLYAFMRAEYLKRLLESRPDLPVLLEDGSACLSRDTIFKTLGERLMWPQSSSNNTPYIQGRSVVQLYPNEREIPDMLVTSLSRGQFIKYAIDPGGELYSHGMESFHGQDHAARVLMLAENIARKTIQNLDMKSLRWACVLHDALRENDFEDENHSQRASDWIKKNLPRIDPEVSADTVAYLCRWHDVEDDSVPEMTPELKILKDADALDLWRIGEEPDSTRLRTQTAKELKEVAFVLVQESIEQSRTVDKPFEAALTAGETLGLVCVTRK